VVGRARPGRIVNGRLTEVALDTGETVRAETFVFATGPWLGKTFPELFTNRVRTPLGYVCYFGTPVDDQRFTYPNLPSWNFPGVTGWAALPVDSRGFRVRGGERAPTPPPKAAKPGEKPPVRQQRRQQPPTPPAQLDPDTSDRWPDATRIEPTRRFVAHRFPLLANAPLLQTHACHYELTSSRNFVVDRHPRLSNVWIAAGGNAEGFKFGPVVGEYIAQRALGTEGDPAVAKGFRIPAEEYPPPPPDTAKAKAR
jgi:glycine/D-amino acid oxidase-like deaminating enzyme